MSGEINFERIRKLVKEDNFLISNHARVRMFQQNIFTDDIKSVIANGEVIEEYADDKPCPSALVLGFLGGTPYHVVVAECEDHVRIITVYIPSEEKWIDYRIRRKGYETG